MFLYYWPPNNALLQQDIKEKNDLKIVNQMTSPYHLQDLMEGDHPTVIVVDCNTPGKSRKKIS